MTTITRYTLAALVCGLLAAGILLWASLERDVAHADDRLAISDLSGAAQAYGDIADRLASLAWLPIGLDRLRSEVEIAEVRIRYWRGEFAGLLADEGRLDTTHPAGDPDLQLVLAAAAYRNGQSTGQTREQLLGALDQAIGRYRQVVVRSGGRRDAAFDYELLIRLREAVAASPDWTPPEAPYPLGREGEQPMDENTTMEDVRIFVPLEHSEREAIEDPTIGSDPTIRRRG